MRKAFVLNGAEVIIVTVHDIKTCSENRGIVPLMFNRGTRQR
jgi:hypothetical protein